jgi:hypothetical protein
MTADELIQALRDAEVEVSLAQSRQMAAQQWLELCGTALSAAYNKRSKALKAIEEVAKPKPSTKTVGDIWKAYGVHPTQLVNGLPVVDPRTVAPLPDLVDTAKGT